MTKQQATNEGLNFTGIYSFDKIEVKSRIEEARKKYPLARIVLVNVPADKLSRSPRNGYSAYADDKYSAYQTLESLGNIEENHNKRLTNIINVHLANVATEEERHTKEREQALKALETLSPCKEKIENFEYSLNLGNQS